VLTGRPVRALRDMETAARRIGEACGAAVLVKGGHRRGDAIDVLWADGELRRFPGRRIRTRSAHGTGCTLSAAIAAGLARGLALGPAIAAAKVYVAGAMRHAPGFGRGNGPLDHLWRRPAPREPRGRPSV
jgi:hydroxymethylpyrimidine/phosphomethylpyrimidine kinase